MRKAICPGSFDPVTFGHIDIIKRASGMFDEVLVASMVNPSKEPIFTLDERLSLLKRALSGISNVKVVSFDGLLADYAKSMGATVIVKGLRAVSDFEYEFQMALTNEKLNPELETIFLTTRAENMFLSSSVVKQIAKFNGDISQFVPSCILEDIRKRLIDVKSKIKKRGGNI